jgi:hypothetical protein
LSKQLKSQALKEIRAGLCHYVSRGLRPELDGRYLSDTQEDARLVFDRLTDGFRERVHLTLARNFREDSSMIARVISG